MNRIRKQQLLQAGASRSAFGLYPDVEVSPVIANRSCLVMPKQCSSQLNVQQVNSVLNRHMHKRRHPPANYGTLNQANLSQSGKRYSDKAASQETINLEFSNFPRADTSQQFFGGTVVVPAESSPEDDSPSIIFKKEQETTNSVDGPYYDESRPSREPENPSEHFLKYISPKRRAQAMPIIAPAKSISALYQESRNPSSNEKLRTLQVQLDQMQQIEQLSNLCKQEDFFRKLNRYKKKQQVEIEKQKVQLHRQIDMSQKQARLKRNVDLNNRVQANYGQSNYRLVRPKPVDTSLQESYFVDFSSQPSRLSQSQAGVGNIVKIKQMNKSKQKFASKRPTLKAMERSDARFNFFSLKKQSKVGNIQANTTSDSFEIKAGDSMDKTNPMTLQTGFFPSKDQQKFVLQSKTNDETNEATNKEMGGDDFVYDPQFTQFNQTDPAQDSSTNELPPYFSTQNTDNKRVLNRVDANKNLLEGSEKGHETTFSVENQPLLGRYNQSSFSSFAHASKTSESVGQLPAAFQPTPKVVEKQEEPTFGAGLRSEATVSSSGISPLKGSLPVPASQTVYPQGRKSVDHPYAFPPSAGAGGVPNYQVRQAPNSQIATRLGLKAKMNLLRAQLPPNRRMNLPRRSTHGYQNLGNSKNFDLQGRMGLRLERYSEYSTHGRDEMVIQQTNQTPLIQHQLTTDNENALMNYFEGYETKKMRVFNHKAEGPRRKKPRVYYLDLKKQRQLGASSSNSSSSLPRDSVQQKVSRSVMGDINTYIEEGELKIKDDEPRNADRVQSVLDVRARGLNNDIYTYVSSDQMSQPNCQFASLADLDFPREQQAALHKTPMYNIRNYPMVQKSVIVSSKNSRLLKKPKLVKASSKAKQFFEADCYQSASCPRERLDSSSPINQMAIVEGEDSGGSSSEMHSKFQYQQRPQFKNRNLLNKKLMLVAQKSLDEDALKAQTKSLETKAKFAGLMNMDFSMQKELQSLQNYMKRVNRISQGKPPEETKVLKKKRTLWEAAENRHASKHSVHSGGTTGGKKQVTFDRDSMNQSGTKGNDRHKQGLNIEIKRQEEAEEPIFNVAKQSEPQLQVTIGEQSNKQTKEEKEKKRIDMQRRSSLKMQNLFLEGDGMVGFYQNQTQNFIEQMESFKDQ